jgi:hypothetical protein
MLRILFFLLLPPSAVGGMVDVQQPRSLDELVGTSLVKQVPRSVHDMDEVALDTQVAKTFHGKYEIGSSRYFIVSTDVSWAAISKNVQNHMLESSIGRAHYDNEKPGIVLIDYYPQPHGAFVLAMSKESRRRGQRLAGYFVLKPKGAVQHSR